jgi:succinate-semialdehyde dehydrogenase/glutarate-semialdehyde dehydrogenase
LGGAPIDRAGFFYAPTVLSGVVPGMRAFDEETFGPVAVVCVAEDPEHAVALANTSQFGLGASIWTADRALAKHLAARLEAGAVFINDIVRSDPRLPFGGVKASGFGRELGSFGIHEFVNIKTVWVS